MKKKRLLATVLAFATISTCAIAATGCSFPDFHFPWDKENSETENPDEGDASDVSGAIIGDVEGNGIALTTKSIPLRQFAEYDVSPLAETAYQVTATITPADATNKQMDWSVAWKDASSAWATGKTVTDYVTIKPTADGSNVATVSCLKAFGEQIVIKGSMRAAPDVAASANVDYVKRLTDFTVSVTNGSSVKLNTAYTYSVTPVYSDGTLTGTLEYGGYIELDSTWANSIKSNMTTYGSKVAWSSPISVSKGSFTLTGATPFEVFVKQDANAFGGTSQMAAAKIEFNNSFARKISDYGVGVPMAKLTIVCNYTYDGSSSYALKTMNSANLRFDGSAFSITPTGVSVDKGSLIF